MPLKRSRGRPRKDAQTQKVTDEVQGSRKDVALLKPPFHVLPTPVKSKECHSISIPLQCQLYVAGDITDAASEDGCTMCCMTIQELWNLRQQCLLHLKNSTQYLQIRGLKIYTLLLTCIHVKQEWLQNTFWEVLQLLTLLTLILTLKRLPLYVQSPPNIGRE